MFNEVDGGVVVSLKVIPKAQKSGLCGCYGAKGKIGSQLQAEKGRANAECIAFLASLLGVPKSSVTIIAGKSRRYKKVYIKNLSLAHVKKLASSDNFR